MKARALPFSATLVPHVLDDSKTQTRRAMSPQPEMVTDKSIVPWDGDPNVLLRLLEQIGRKCPYGKVGDLLYVKEDYYQYGHWEPVEGVKTKGGKPKWKFVPDSEEILFEAPPVFRSSPHRAEFQLPCWYKRLGRFMPRRYSRITLEITDIRVERLNEISEADAKAEGLRWHSLYKEWGGAETHPDSRPECPQWRWYELPVEAFKNLWESINGAGSWKENPWVWVIFFKRAA